MKTTTCKICGHTKNWLGSDIECSFLDKEEFSADNWSCGILTNLRTVISNALLVNDDRVIYQSTPDGENYAYIRLNDLENGDGEILGSHLWVNWYKHRGRTNAMWLLSEDNPPRVPTFEEINTVITYLGVNNQ
jgi:hypothetical protein